MRHDLEGLGAFRARARAEAGRYGDDPWVFVRELIQNARDADATRIRFTIEDRGDRVRLTATDDGRGMSLAHARRYLFTLYASSKRGRKRTAGRFGVGFWSLLELAPEVVVVRSRSAGEAAWEVRLEGGEAHVTDPAHERPTGTEVVLEGAVGGAATAAAVRRAVAELAGFVRRRDRPELPLAVLVDGVRVSSDLKLGAPLLRFWSRGVRGVVAFAAEPRVELYVHGFRVRTAAVLDDLRPPGDGDRGVAVAMPEGVAPHVVLDCDRLDLLMSRAEPRHGRELERVLRLAERQLGRLLECELERIAPRSRWGRLAELARAPARWAGRRRRVAAALVLAAIGVAVGALWLDRLRADAESRPVSARTATAAPLAPFIDLATSYRGPSVEGIVTASSAPDIHFSPPAAELLVAGLRVRRIDDSGRARIAELVSTAVRGASCTADCVELRVRYQVASSTLRLPVPTGYVVATESVRLAGRIQPLALSAAGELVVAVTAGQADELRYRAAPGPDPNPFGDAAWPEVPPEWRRMAATWRGGSALDVARAAERLVRDHVRYDRGAQTAARYAAGVASGVPLVARALSVGAGDCDVQNTLVAALVEAAGVPARLAVGWLGTGGRMAPGMHAWVEVRDEAGTWRVADASTGAAAVGSPPAPREAVPAAAAAAGRESRHWVPVITLLAIALVALGGLVAMRRRAATVVGFVPGDGSDLDQLVAGLVTRPGQWPTSGAWAARPLLDAVDGSRLSLAQARRLAGAGRLYLASVPRPALAPAGQTVDSRWPRCRVAAEALGAPDLDRWQKLLAGARADPALVRAEQVLRRCGVPLVLRVTSAENVAPLEVLCPGRGSPVVVLAAGGPLWPGIAAAARSSDGLAAALVLEAVVPAVVRDAGERAALLSDVARQLLAATGATP